jgi:serine/threonine protein kinase
MQQKEELINNKYRLLEKLGSGSYGSIFKAENVRTKELVAIKVESIQEELKLLKNESKIYHYLQGCTGIVPVKWYGKDSRNYYMVIHLLGKSLQDVLNKEGRFSLCTTLKIGINILTIIKTLHEKGLVHRDIKPDNFLFGIHNFHSLYLIDFGFCKTFLTNNSRQESEHILPKKTHNLIGSKNYASIMSHSRMELSRRDDMESFCYLLFALFHGSLKWSFISDECEIIRLKRTLVDDPHQPAILVQLLREVRCMEFEEKPNYFLILDNFKKEIQCLNKSI